VELDNIKLLWDFNVQTDQVIECRQPDIFILDQKQGQCHIKDIVVPGDNQVVDKEKEKLAKY